jgi:hypothetical protein
MCADPVLLSPRVVASPGGLFHANVDAATGRVMVSQLGADWSPIMSLGGIFDVLQAIMEGQGKHTHSLTLHAHFVYTTHHTPHHTPHTTHHTPHQHTNTPTHQHINTSTHQHINTPTHQHTNTPHTSHTTPHHHTTHHTPHHTPTTSHIPPATTTTRAPHSFVLTD